jgi:O-antigen/teichoic acid export membrane protein
MKKLLQHPLFSGSVLMVGGNLFANVVNFVYQLVMGKHLLSTIQYGELSSVFAIFYIVTIVPISTSASIVKFVSSAKNHGEVALIYKKVNGFIFKLALVLSAIIFLVSPILSSFLHVQLSEMLIVAPVVFFSLITISNQALLQGVLRFWGNVGPNIISGIIKLVSGVLLVILGFKVFGAVMGVGVGAVLAYFYSWYLANNFLRNISLKGKFDFRKFFKYSFPVLIFSLAFTSFFTMDLILVRHFLPDFQAGIYAALSTLGKIIFFAASPIASVMFPLVAGRHSRGEEYFKLLLMALVATLLVSLGVVFLYALFPNVAIGVLYGARYLTASKDLIWMGLFICFYTISYFMMNFFLSIDEVKLVVLPFIFAILQIILIWFYHESLLEVIQISLMLMFVLSLILFSYLVYNRFKYAKKN